MTDVADTRAEWLASRRLGVGASDVAGILGLSPWASPYSVWFDKVYGADDDGETLAMAFGRRAEPMVAAWFNEKTGLYVGGQQLDCRHPVYDWRRCTIDGLVYETPHAAFCLSLLHDFDYRDCDCRTRLGALEIKTTSATPKEWADNGIPIQYQCQAQWTMHVTDTTRVWFAVLHLAFGRPDLIVYELERDDDDIAALIEAVDRFWFNHVVTRVAPATDATDATTEATKRLPANAGATVELTDPNVVAAVTALAMAKVQAKAWEDNIAAQENIIRAALGEATEGHHDGTLIVSNRPQSRTGIDAKAFRARMPRTAARFTTDTTFRVLRRHTPKESK